MIYVTQNEAGDGVTISLDSTKRDCKTLQDVADFLNEISKRDNVDYWELGFTHSSSLNWPRDHPNCTDGCVKLCNELTGNSVE